MRLTVKLQLNAVDDTSVELAVTPIQIDHFSDVDFLELVRPCLETILRNARAHKELSGQYIKEGIKNGEINNRSKEASALFCFRGTGEESLSNP